MSASNFDLSRFLPYLLNQTAEHVGAGFAATYRDRYGLLRNDWRVLAHLGSYGRMTAREISDRSLLHKTKISRAVARLQERRYLVRDRDEADRRVEHLSLSAQGRQVFQDLQKVAEAYDQSLEARLGAGRAAEFRRMLDQLSEGG